MMISKSVYHLGTKFAISWEKFDKYKIQHNAIKQIKRSWVDTKPKEHLNQSWAINIKLHLVIYIWIFLLIVSFVNAFVCWRGIFGNSLQKASHHTKHHVIWIVHENAFVKCQTTQWLVVVVEVKYAKLFIVARVVVYFGLYVIGSLRKFKYLFALIFCIYAKCKKVEHFLEHTSRFCRNKVIFVLICIKEMLRFSFPLKQFISLVQFILKNVKHCS